MKFPTFHAVQTEKITVRDTHEAIITQDVFDLVQAKMKGRKRQTEQGEYSMFAGLFRCAECGWRRSTDRHDSGAAAFWTFWLNYGILKLQGNRIRHNPKKLMKINRSCGL